MKIIYTLLVFIAAMAMLQAEAHASGLSVQNIGAREIIDSYGVSRYDSEIKSAAGEIEELNGESFSEIVAGVLNGSLSLSFYDLLKLFAGRLFKEVLDNLAIMRDMLAIIILGAALKSLSGSLGEGSVAEIGFYVIYIAMIALVIASFASASEIAAASISRLADFTKALIPLIIALLAASGRYAVSFVFPPAALAVIQVSTFLINYVVLKAIIWCAAVQMTGFLLPKGAFSGLGELARLIIGKGLKLTAIIFMSFISLKTATAPIVGGVAGKGARLAVSGVPVVGQVFVGAVDSAFYWANAVKNGVAAAAVIFVAFICFTPVIKLMAIALIYKLTSALAQPVADERVTDCLDAAGDYAALFITAVACVGVMFTALLMMVMAAAVG